MSRGPWYGVGRCWVRSPWWLCNIVASFLISAFRGNPAAAIFGPVIVLMLFFNIFAQLVLFIAAWIATAEHEAVPVPAEEEVRHRARAGTLSGQPRMRSRMSYRRLWRCVRYALAWALATSPEPRPESGWARRSRTCSQPRYAAGRRPDEPLIVRSQCAVAS